MSLINKPLVEGLIEGVQEEYPHASRDEQAKEVSRRFNNLQDE